MKPSGSVDALRGGRRARGRGCPRSPRTLALAALVSVFLGCGLANPTFGAPSDALGFYDDAVARLDRNDVAGAIIQLNNALQKDPNLLAAHVLLGKVRMQNGDPANAEASFSRALRLGADRAEVALPLAQAYFAQRKFDVLLERVLPDGLPQQTRIEVLLLRGNSYAEKDKTADAQRSFEEARALDPQSLAVRLALVNLLIRTDQLVRANVVLEEALKLAPSEVTVWTLRAHMAHLKGDLKGALDDYAKAIVLDPKNVDAHRALAGLQLDTGRFDEAEKTLATLKELAPRDPQAAYLRAILAKLKGDNEGARRELSYVVSVLDRIPREGLNRNRELLLVAGLSHHGLGDLEKAAQYLALYVRANPKQTGPAKVLASIYIDRGDIGRAIQVLVPLEVAAPDDPQVLTLLAAAHLAEQRFAEANALLEKAVKISGGAPDSRINLGLGLIANGQADVGFAQLQQALMKDPSQSRAGIVMATLLIKREQPKKAVEVIDAVVQRNPKNVDALNLQGLAKVSAGDLAGGRVAYERALALDPEFYSSRLNLARLDLSEGKLEAARARLLDLLKANPKDGEAMMEFARLEERIGRPAESIKWLEAAVNIPASRIAAQIQLSGLLIRQGEFERAVAVARDASARAPNDINALFALSRAQLAKNDKIGARQTLGSMGSLAGFNANHYFEIARLQVAADDRDAAHRSLEKALEALPEYMPALRMITEMEIADSSYARAEQHARRAIDKFPTSGIGHRLLGDVLAARGQHAAAITSYRAALAKDKSAMTVIHLYDAMVIVNGRGNALAFLEQWHRDNPDDSMILRALADGRASAGNLAGARTDYERLLQRNPNDVEVLNNVAQVALRQKDNAALSFAERAYQLANNRAAVLDTFGWVLVSQGQLERGTTLLREARLRDTSNPEIRYHLAAALAKSGRDAEARSELQEGLKAGASYEGIEEARNLQRRLGP